MCGRRVDTWVIDTRCLYLTMKWCSLEYPRVVLTYLSGSASSPYSLQDVSRAASAKRRFQVDMTAVVFDGSARPNDDGSPRSWPTVR